jgi:hypothetical protein
MRHDGQENNKDGNKKEIVTKKETSKYLERLGGNIQFSPGAIRTSV